MIIEEKVVEYEKVDGERSYDRRKRSCVRNDSKISLACSGRAECQEIKSILPCRLCMGQKYLR